MVEWGFQKALAFVNPLHKPKVSTTVFKQQYFSDFMGECHIGDTRFLCDGTVKCLGWKYDRVHAAQD